MSDDVVPRGEPDRRDGREETATGTRAGTGTGIGAGTETRTERRVYGRESPGTYQVLADDARHGGAPTGNQKSQPQDPRS